MPVELTLEKNHYSEVRYYGVVLLQGYVEELLKGGNSVPFLARERLPALDRSPRSEWWHPASSQSGNTG
ncbi:MAG: hypothetical protein U1G07_17130 [Verrucomicrobiota bacterium]